jgi:hypothetical protein
LVGSLEGAAPIPQCHHIGPEPGLVDEDEPLRFGAISTGSPPGDVRTLAFARHDFLKPTFSASTNSHTER